MGTARHTGVGLPSHARFGGLFMSRPGQAIRSVPCPQEAAQDGGSAGGWKNRQGLAAPAGVAAATRGLVAFVVLAPA
jgi:hypothetical protein